MLKLLYPPETRIMWHQ